MAGNRSPSALSIKNQTRDRVTLHLRGALPLGFLETSQSKNPAQDRHFRALHAVPSYGDVIPRPGVFGRASGDAPDARRSDGRWVPSTYRWNVHGRSRSTGRAPSMILTQAAPSEEAPLPPPSRSVMRLLDSTLLSTTRDTRVSPLR
jgi:hypothetical protein